MSDTKDAGIDQIRVISGLVQFDEAHPRTRVSIPNADGGIIEDIVFSLHGATNPYMTAAGSPFRSPEDVRIHLRATQEVTTLYLDLTDSLLIQTRALLDKSDPKSMAESYQHAMETFLASVESQRISSYSPQMLARDKQLIKTLASTQPLSSLLNRLGDRSVGLGGSLDLFNYLFDELYLPGISLKQLLEQKKIKITELKNISLEFEHPFPTGGVGEVSGAVAFKAEVIVHNSLREQLEDLENTILTAIQDIESKLQAKGDIMQSLVNAQDQLLALKTTMESLEARLVSSQAEIQQLKTSNANISAKIDGLH